MLIFWSYLNYKFVTFKFKYNEIWVNEVIKISKSINLLEKYVQKPTKGLPEDIFYFVGRLTPYI